MGAGREREVKLDAGMAYVLPDMAGVIEGVGAAALPVGWLDAVYFDTPTFRLLRAGITLRHRRERSAAGPDRSEWTLKLPESRDGSVLVRRELTWTGEADLIPAEALSLVRAHRRTTPLSEVARLVTQRRRVELRDVRGTAVA
ncbi:MAG: CYTH domain-containing protein, partial [Acidimicrobiales bacterium]